MVSLQTSVGSLVPNTGPNEEQECHAIGIDALLFWLIFGAAAIVFPYLNRGD